MVLAQVENESVVNVMSFSPQADIAEESRRFGTELIATEPWGLQIGDFRRGGEWYRVVAEYDFETGETVAVEYTLPIPLPGVDDRILAEHKQMFDALIAEGWDGEFDEAE